MTIIGEVINTGRRGDILSTEWKIPDFLSLDGYYYESPFFNACGGVWSLRIHPKGSSRFPSPECVSLFLMRWGDFLPQTFYIAVGIRGTEGLENRKERSQEFSREYDRECYWRLCYSRSELIKNQSRLMLGNMLVIVLDIKKIVPSSATGGEKALKDLGKLLDSGEKSDVIVQIGDIEFNVHSCILFARSPALSVSLQHESKEKASNRIVIEDCEPDAFRHFLHYLYTGSVQSLDEKTVSALYCIADKYLVEDLKQYCVEHIKDTLSVQTFFNSMKLALIYGECDLLEKASDFAIKNFRSIVSSEEWQDFSHEYPTEAKEIFIKSFSASLCKKL